MVTFKKHAVCCLVTLFVTSWCNLFSFYFSFYFAKFTKYDISPFSSHLFYCVHIAMPYLVVYIWMFVTSLCWKIYIKVLVYSVNILGSSLGHTGSNLVVQILAFLCIFCVKLQLINLSNNRPLSSQLIQSCIAKHKVYSTFKNGSLLVWKLTSDLSIVPALLSQ